MNSKVFIFILLSVLLLPTGCVEASKAKEEKKNTAPRIINIVNFIRQTDYRLENSDALMFETVEKQIDLVNQYDFPATFLFQYDAVINPE